MFKLTLMASSAQASAILAILGSTKVTTLSADSLVPIGVVVGLMTFAIITTAKVVRIFDDIRNSVQANKDAIEEIKDKLNE